jgi:hypothetical protein
MSELSTTIQHGFRHCSDGAVGLLQPPRYPPDAQIELKVYLLTSTKKRSILYLAN